jgi:hypothetical protein
LVHRFVPPVVASILGSVMVWPYPHGPTTMRRLTL